MNNTWLLNGPGHPSEDYKVLKEYSKNYAAHNPHKENEACFRGKTKRSKPVDFNGSIKEDNIMEHEYPITKKISKELSEKRNNESTKSDQEYIRNTYGIDKWWASTAPAYLKVLSVSAGNTYTGDSQDLVICIKHMDWNRNEICAATVALLDVATSFDDTFVAGLAEETYFAVNLRLVGWKIYNKHITHDINCSIYLYIQVTVSFNFNQNLKNT